MLVSKATFQGSKRRLFTAAVVSAKTCYTSLIKFHLNMSKLKNFLVGAALVAVPFSGAIVHSVHAETSTGDISGNLDAVQENSGLGDNELDQTLGLLINVLL